MINDFLTRLLNVNDNFHGIYREAVVRKPYSGLRRSVRDVLMGNVNSSEQFRTAVEITLLLRNSVLAPWEIHEDKRITYNDDDLTAALAGAGSGIEGSSHPLSFIVVPSTPSKQQWTVTYLGGGTMLSVDEDGRRLEVSGLVFPANSWVQFDLAGKQGKAQVLGEPAVDEQWVITRDVDYVSQISAITDRLNDISEDDVIQILPEELIGVYRNTPVLRPILRIVAAAVGVAYGS